MLGPQPRPLQGPEDPVLHLSPAKTSLVPRGLLTPTISEAWAETHEELELRCCRDVANSHEEQGEAWSSPVLHAGYGPKRHKDTQAGLLGRQTALNSRSCPLPDPAQWPKGPTRKKTRSHSKCPLFSKSLLCGGQESSTKSIDMPLPEFRAPLTRLPAPHLPSSPHQKPQPWSWRL